MNEEYMPEYRPLDTRAIASKLVTAKWSLIIMAALTFFWAVYLFVTAPEGGAGGLLPTPVEGPAGLVSVLPWWCIIAGCACAVASLASRAPRALGWVEPVFDIVLLLAGLWGIYSIPLLGSFSEVHTALGVFLALYLAVVALELYVRDERMWYVEMIVAAAVLAISLAGGVNFAVVSGQVGYFSLALFVAGWGFVYGAIKLGAKGASVSDEVADR